MLTLLLRDGRRSKVALTPPEELPIGFPGAGQPAVDERRESRALELAESNCVSQGKDVEAGRIEGQTVYNCVRR